MKLVGRMHGFLGLLGVYKQNEKLRALKKVNR